MAERYSRARGKCQALTPEQVDYVLSTFFGRYAARDKALFIMGCKTGYRISELLSLRVGDVLQNGRLADRVTVQRRDMKGETRSRTVPLNEQVQGALVEWIAQLRREGHDSPDSYLFQSRQGVNRPLSRSQASKIIHDALEAGEVQGTLGTHVMRKSFARNALALSGNNARLVQKALGHSKLSTTEAYLDVDQDAVDQVVLAM